MMEEVEVLAVKSLFPTLCQQQQKIECPALQKNEKILSQFKKYWTRRLEKARFCPVPASFAFTRGTKLEASDGAKADKTRQRSVSDGRTGRLGGGGQYEVPLKVPLG